MTEVFSQIFPIILAFFTGIALKQLKLLLSKDADFLLKLIFYVGIPSLVFSSFHNAEIEKQFIFLPFTAVFVLCFCGSLTFLISLFFKPGQKTKGAAVSGSMIMNTGFCLPFIEAFYGPSAIVAVLIFDIGNAFFVFTATYFIAGRFSSYEKIKLKDFLNFLKNPPLISIIIVSALNFSDIQMYKPVTGYFEFMSQIVLPLIMIAIGIKFDLRGKISKYLFSVIFSRMAGGFAAAYFVLLFFETDPLIRAGILICASAPVGYNTITFSVLRDLDNEFAASAVSLSAFAGLLIYPFMHYYLTG